MASLYETRTMLAAVRLMKPVSRFLWDTFVKPNAQYSYSEVVDVDFMRGTTRMAPFVEASVGGVVVDREGFDTATIKFPSIAPERLIRPSDLTMRGMGENVYSAMTPQQREQELIGQDLLELRRMVAERKEWMVAQLLFGTPGKLLLDVMTDKGLKKSAIRVDYGFTNEVAIATPWTSAAADPTSDLEAVTDACRDTGSGNPDIIIMGAGAARAYRKNPNVQKELDIRHLQVGSVTAQYRGNYLKFIGISPNGLEMYSYSGSFIDDDGTVKTHIPDGRVSALPKQVLNAIFGPVIQMEPGNDRHTHYYGDQEVPLYLPDYKSNTTGLRLTSRPMLAPDNVDAWAFADVL